MNKFFWEDSFYRIASWTNPPHLSTDLSLSGLVTTLDASDEYDDGYDDGGHDGRRGGDDDPVQLLGALWRIYFRHMESLRGVH